VRPEGLCL